MNPDIVSLADRVIAAFNQGDWNHLSRVLAPDIIYTETGTNRSVWGVTPYLELLKGWREVLPDCVGTIQATVADGNRVVHQIEWQGTQAAPLPTPAGVIPNTGRRIQVPASVWYVIEGNRVTSLRHDLDVFSLFQQLGMFEQQSQAPAAQRA